MKRAAKSGGSATCRILIALFCSTVWSVTGLTAQSITSGELNGLVVDLFGQPIQQARVVASSVTSGWQRTESTPGSGAFRFIRVPPGEYELLVEIIGYRPVVVVGIPIRPGERTRVPVTIAPAAPPVLQVDTVSLDLELTGIVTPGGGRWIQGEAVNDYPDRLRTISSLSSLSSRFDPSMGSEGLPASMTQIFLDGIPFSPARHPWLPGGGLEALILPRSGLAYLAFPEVQTDIEGQGGAGGYTIVGTQSGEQRNTIDVFGSGSTDHLWSSGPFDTRVPSLTSFWGGARASIPLIPDTTRLFVAVEGYQVETPRLPILTDPTASALPGLGERASELSVPWVERTRSISGINRVDWALSPTSSLQVGAMAAALEDSRGLAKRFPTPYGTTPPLEALDVLISATLTTRPFAAADLEFRASFQRSTREHPGVNKESIPGTRLVDSGEWIGLDPSLPTRVSRTSFVGGPTLHFSIGQRHHIKVGGQFSIPSFEYRFPNRGVGSFVYSGADEVTSGDGAFTQIADPRPQVSFSLPRVSGFAQYAWDALPGLRLTSGFRYDAEFLPDEDVIVNGDWIAASELGAESLKSTFHKFSPRIGLRWDLRGEGNTVFVAGAGTHYGELDPGALSEVFAFGGGIDVRRGVGNLGGWPSLPDDTAVPVTGERITLMGAGVESPRTRRGHVGLWQLLGKSTVLRASGSFRRTEFLLRRTDLNLVTAAAGSDQFGRPVFGQLAQQGSVLTSVPGSDRRFAGFDQVWALNPDGWSEQVAATVSLDHRVADGLELFASYTWSETTDNWLGVASGQPGAALDPGLDDLSPTPWSEGRSDLDIPHRATAGLLVRYSAVALTGTYRFRSAYPFTAGYRAGVDANGDGSALNDVSFVPDDPAVLDLARRWSCLATALERFAKRNSCRRGDVHALDVRLGLALFRSGGRRVELVVEGFNLVESREGLRDTALLLVDGSRQVSIDPPTGDVDVPVTVNPSFGKKLSSTSAGRMIRIGFRVGGGVR